MEERGARVLLCPVPLLLREPWGPALASGLTKVSSSSEAASSTPTRGYISTELVSPLSPLQADNH